MKTRALLLLLVALLLAGVGRRIRARKRVAQKPVACAEVLGIAYAGGWRLACGSDPELRHCSDPQLSGSQSSKLEQGQAVPSSELVDSQRAGPPSSKLEKGQAITRPELADSQRARSPSSSLPPGAIYDPHSCQRLAPLPGQVLLARGQQIDLNQATATDLEALPGIGPSLARRIVAERAERPFESVDDLERVSGIGPKRIEAVAGGVRVGE